MGKVGFTSHSYNGGLFELVDNNFFNSFLVWFFNRLFCPYSALVNKFTISTAAVVAIPIAAIIVAASAAGTQNAITAVAIVLTPPIQPTTKAFISPHFN